MASNSTILHEWKRLSEEQREAMLPDLLMGMRGWRAWATDPRSCLYWLERIFERRGKRLLQATRDEAHATMG